MYTKRTFHKHSALLSLLAILYLVLGSQAIHPRFHSHSHSLDTENSEHICFCTGAHHNYHDGHNHTAQHNAQSLSTPEPFTENCPVCAILSCCWFAPFSINSIEFHIGSSLLATSKYSAHSIFLQPSVYRIRGPPIIIC